VTVPSGSSPPRGGTPWRRIATVAAVLVVIAALVAFIPGHVDELREELRRMESGDWRWLLVAALLEVGSFAGYVVLFRSVFSDEQRTIAWGESYQITMAGVVATRLFAAAGAGGVALTAWALRRTGMRAATVGRRMVEFLVSLYAVYMLALVLAGMGLSTGALPGPAPFGLTVPFALLGGAAIVVALATTLVPSNLAARFEGRGRVVLGNLLPLPGGVGGVDGGIIAALVGFGVGGGIALLAVLTHRVFAFWLPTIPGGIAYLQLRRTVGRWESDPDPAPAPA